MALTPLLDSFKRGDVARDARLLAAQGELAPRAAEQLAILTLLLNDQDQEIRGAAEATLAKIATESIQSVLAASDIPTGLREFFAARGIEAAGAGAIDLDAPLIDTGVPGDVPETKDLPDSVQQQIGNMNFP